MGTDCQTRNGKVEATHGKKIVDAGYEIFQWCSQQIRAVVPKLVVNYPLGIIFDSSGSNAEPKP